MLGACVGVADESGEDEGLDGVAEVATCPREARQVAVPLFVSTSTEVRAKCHQQLHG